MKHLDRMHAAFRDELQKIAGELQGAVRSGRTPMHVETYLKKESDKDKASEIVKVSGNNKWVIGGSAVAGAAGYEALRRANKDRKLGRQVRLQSRGQ